VLYPFELRGHAISTQFSHVNLALSGRFMNRGKVRTKPRFLPGAPDNGVPHSFAHFANEWAMRSAFVRKVFYRARFDYE